MSMKKLRLLISTTLALPLLTMSASPALALSGSDSNSGSDSSTTSDSSTDQTKTPTAEEVAKKLADMKKRIEDNKAALKTKVDDATKKRIVAKCKPAQTIVKGAETSMTEVSSNRVKAFTKISEAVQKLIDKLKANGKDTTEVEADLAVAKTKAETLATAMTDYKATLADLRDMDCATDPTAFAATLATARTQRDAAKAAATDLRTYLSNTLKPAINKLKNQLEAEKTSTTENKTGGNQ